MTFFRILARHILGIDDTETSDQEIFIKELYSNQKEIISEINKENITTFINTLINKHDLLGFSLVLNRQILMRNEDFDKKEIMKYIDFFENVKSNLRKKIVLLEGSPWVGLFERDNLVFVTKKEVKLSDIEINAIIHDVLNAKEVYCQKEQEIINEKIVTKVY